MAKDDIGGWGMLGFVIGIATAYVLKFISQLLSAIPGVSVDLQAISVSTQGLIEVVDPGKGLSGILAQMFGAIPFALTIPDILMVGLGGAVFAILGFLAYNSFEPLRFAKGKLGKFTTIMVLAGVISGMVVSMNLSIPAITAIVVMTLNAAILGWIALWIDKQLLKGQLVP